VKLLTTEKEYPLTKGFIRYESKNGVEYASLYKARREGGKKINDIEWLGRVIDKEKGIFKSRERGTFLFTLKSGAVEYLPPVQEKLILDFGDSYFLNVMLINSGFMDLLERIFGNSADTVASLVFYKSLRGGPNCYAQTWWEGSYARILFPSASLPSQRVSEILREIGDEQLQRDFFRDYLQYIASRCSGCILVDSTGLPNDIHFPLTAINNHNGVISNETRLILVIDRISGLPIYFRYAAGNIVDVSTLETTIAEMKSYGINVKHAIVDAGYYSNKNTKSLQKNAISFITRLAPNRKLYKDLIAEHISGLEDAKYLVKYRERYVYMKRVEVDLFGKPGYAYVAEDIDRKHEEIKKYINAALEDNDVTSDEMNVEMQSKGLFILISSAKIETKDILPLYYTRQAIEQIFDIGKNNSDLLPLRVHGIDSFRGHLLLSFIVSVAYILVNTALKGSDVCATGAYQILRNLKCKVYDKKIIVQEANKKMNDIAKHVKITYPMEFEY